MKKMNKKETPVLSKGILEEEKTSYKWYYSLLWWLRYGIWRKLRMFPKEIYWFFQRGKRGYSDSDTWGFCDYLADVIHGGLKQLYKYRHGTPATLNPKTGEYDHDEKRWNKTLKDMIYTFETVKKILDNYPEQEWLYTPTKDWAKHKDFRNRFRDTKLMKIMTKKECLKYEKGWQLFAEHFLSLWD